MRGNHDGRHPRAATLADLDDTPDDGRRYELISGQIVVSESPGWEHQVVSGHVLRLTDGWVERHDLGEVVPGPVAIVLDEANVVLPDIVYAATANLSNIREGRYHGAPDLIVEVISPTSRNHDAVTKMFRYACCGVPEYWLVDPFARTIQILSLLDGIYVPQKANADGRLASVVLPGLTIDPAAIFPTTTPAT